MIHSLKQVKFITIPELDIKELLLKLVDECPFVTYSKWFECNCLLGYFQTIYIIKVFSQKDIVDRQDLKITLITDLIDYDIYFCPFCNLICINCM